LLVTIVKNN